MLLVDRLEEMRRLEEVGDAVERLVVDQDRAEQRLLGLDVVRGGAERQRVLGRGAYARFERHAMIIEDARVC